MRGARLLVALVPLLVGCGGHAFRVLHQGGPALPIQGAQEVWLSCLPLDTVCSIAADQVVAGLLPLPSRVVRPGSRPPPGSVVVQVSLRREQSTFEYPEERGEEMVDVTYYVERLQVQTRAVGASGVVAGPDLPSFELWVQSRHAGDASRRAARALALHVLELLRPVARMRELAFRMPTGDEARARVSAAIEQPDVAHCEAIEALLSGMPCPASASDEKGPVCRERAAVLHAAGQCRRAIGLRDRQADELDRAEAWLREQHDVCRRFVCLPRPEWGRAFDDLAVERARLRSGQTLAP